MSKNIAILIGVSDYQHVSNLPACQADVDLVGVVLNATKKYEPSDILVLDKSPQSSNAKRELTNFIKSRESETIDEVFFYYSGHGTRIDDDFLYLFADFDRAKVAQTSLSNTELDDQLKSMNPKLVVKVVDACQAGTTYVKDENTLKDVINKSRAGKFENVYFLFSSMETQSSIANRDLSVFTRSFLSSIASRTPGTFRYKDLVDHITDDIVLQAQQTPFFVIQAKNTEVFFEIESSLQNELNGYLLNVDSSVQSALTFSDQLVAAAKEKSELCCSEADAQVSLEYFISAVSGASWRNPISALFEVKVGAESNNDKVPKIEELGRLFSKFSDEYFAEATYADETYETWESPLTASLFLSSPRRVTKTRRVVNGLRQTAKAPCSAILISFEPKEPSLPYFSVFIPFIFSKQQLTAFTLCERERESSWRARTPAGDGTWQRFECPLGNKGEIEKMSEALVTHVRGTVITAVARVVGVREGE